MWLWMIYLLLINCLTSCTATSATTNEIEQEEAQYIEKRTALVQLLQEKGISDSLTLAAMIKVKRHNFVPDKWRDDAYVDHPLPIGFDQTISQPFIVAFMTEKLQLTGKEKVLEIGTGSGYQAAVLAELADSVFTIEIIDSLSLHAQEVLTAEGYKNIKFKIGDGFDGWPEKGPFDCIIVSAAPKNIPQPLLDQLKNGGRMIIPLGNLWQNLYLISKDPDGNVQQESVLPVRFVPMTGKARDGS